MNIPVKGTTPDIPVKGTTPDKYSYHTDAHVKDYIFTHYLTDTEYKTRLVKTGRNRTVEMTLLLENIIRIDIDWFINMFNLYDTSSLFTRYKTNTELQDCVTYRIIIIIKDIMTSR